MGALIQIAVTVSRITNSIATANRARTLPIIAHSITSAHVVQWSISTHQDSVHFGGRGACGRGEGEGVGSGSEEGGKGREEEREDREGKNEEEGGV